MAVDTPGGPGGGRPGPGTDADLGAELADLDALEIDALGIGARGTGALGIGIRGTGARGTGAREIGARGIGAPTRARRLAGAWSALWPKVAGLAVVALVWQAAVWTRWRPPSVLPGPGVVLARLGHDAGTAGFWEAIATTARRAVAGYSLAVVAGVGAGACVACSRVMRSALGSLVTGLQTMPSIAWFPLAILLFRPSEAAITFVVVLGAAPSIANGFVSGVDHVPALWLRSGRMLGARGVGLWRHVIVPAALPSVLSGLEQGWAFAWRSLMAGELLVSVSRRPSMGGRLHLAQASGDAVGLVGLMVVILVVGMGVDAVFSAAHDGLRRRRGLIPAGPAGGSAAP